MDKLSFVLALFLLVGAAKINGQSVTDLVSLIPEDVKIEPMFETRTPPPEQINDRLLTPKEGCGYSPYGAPRVVGGGPARNGQYPWMAFLAYDRPHSDYGIIFGCGGSLITSRHVLTAAHCVHPGVMLFARFGEHDYRTTEEAKHQDVKIVNAKLHPKYNLTDITYDVAVLTLERHVIFDDRIRPICLPHIDPQMRSHNFAGSNPFVAGWGGIGLNKGNSPYLKHLQLPVMDTRSCLDAFYRANLMDAHTRISDATVCAGGVEGRGCFFGDSGGPLMLPVNQGNGKFQYYQVGVVSWVMGCALHRIPAVFQSTQFFGDWIETQIQ